MRTKNPIEPANQGDPFYGMSRECGKVCIGETENQPQSSLEQSKVLLTGTQRQADFTLMTETE